MIIDRHDLLSSAQAATSAASLSAMFAPQHDLKGSMLVSLALVSLHALQNEAVSAEMLVEQAQALQEAISAAPDPDAIGMDPLILAALIEQFARSRISFSALDATVDQLASALSNLPDDARAVGRIRMLCAMLRNAGVDIAPAPPPRDFAARLVTADMLLDADDQGLLEIVDQSFAGGVGFENDAGKVLGPLMLTLLRDYRIDIASRALRAMLVQEHDRDTAREALRFIAVQRGSDGLYGYYDPFSDRYSDAASRNRELRLPITMNALWLFATAVQLHGSLELQASPA